MKTTIKILVLLLVAAASNGAQAQQSVKTPPDGKAYAIRSTHLASGNAADVTYQWFRNDDPIGGATDTSYTVPASDAYGMNVKFERKATMSDESCSGTDEGWSNPVYVSFLPAPSSIITGSTSVCSGQAGLSYSVPNVPGTTYTWTVPGGWLITAGHGTNSITVTAGTVGGMVSATPSSTAYGYTGTARTLAVEVRTTPAIPSEIVANPAAICPNQAGITYTVTNVPGTTYTWTVPGNWTITYGDGTNSITATAYTAGGTVSVTPRICGNSGPSRSLVVNVGTAPVQPSEISGSASVCPAEADIAYSVTNVPGVSYTWSVTGAGWEIASGQGTSSVMVTSGTVPGSLSVTPSTSCAGNGPARTLNISIRTAPAQPSSITASHTNICSGQSGITYTVANVQGVYYTWSVPANWGITDGQGTSSITVTASVTAGEVSATPSVCGSIVGTPSTLPVAVGAAPAQPSAITGNTTVCSGATNVYSVTSVSGVTYTWSVPASWSVLYGQNTNSLTVTVGAAAGVISVMPSNCGGNGTARTLTTSMGTGAAPAQPSAITINPATICPNQTGVTLSVTNVAGVSYAWQVPAGWSITAGQGSNSITVRAGTAGGNVSVTPSVCGGVGAARTVAVTVSGNAPAQPSAITANPATVCANQTGVVYSVTSVPGVSYAWTVPNGWTITAGQNTGSITVTAGNSGGDVTVTPSVNACTNAGTPQTLAVAVNGTPAQPSAIRAGNSIVTAGHTGLTYSVTNVPGVSYAWSVPPGWMVTAGQGTNSITATAGSAPGNATISVTPSACGNTGTAQSRSVTVNATPPQPSAITANPATICANQPNIVYSVTNVPGTTYAWNVPAGWLITSGDGFNSITVTAGTVGGNVEVTPSVGGVVGAMQTLAVSLTATPAQPSAISGVTATCSGSAGIAYWVESVSGVSYDWSVPAGWTIVSGQGTDNITVATGNAGGNVSVEPSLAACSSVGSSQTLVVAVSTTCGTPCASSNGTSIAGLCWANRNVAASGVFAIRPDVYTEFYQWNRTTAYSASNPLSPAWNTTPDQSASWANNGQPPCPTGWRLPTQAEFNNLHNASTPAGGSWVNANERGVAVAGRFCGPSHATCTSSSMGGCVFLPAVGYRGRTAGALSNQGTGGNYWSATQYDSLLGYYTTFGTTNNLPDDYVDKTTGLTLRCVQ